MFTVEFDINLQNIMSAAPQDKRHKLRLHPIGHAVRVIILAIGNVVQEPKKTVTRKDLLQDAKENGYDDFFEYLMDNPVSLPNPIRFTREELHAR